MVQISIKNNLRTRTDKISLWRVFKGLHVLTPNGVARVINIRRSEETDMRLYTIDTYAQTLYITCTPTTEVLTEKGYKEIQEVKKDDVLVIKGVFVYKKLTAVKSISSSLVRDEGTCIVSLMNENELFINNIAVKL